MMKAQELVNRCVDIAKNYKTVYMWGAIGFPVTNAAIDSKAAQYPSWYTADKKARFRALVGKGYFGFDCIGMIKSVLWGWDGNASATYGGAKYASNGVPDLSADGTIKHCKNVSTDFSHVPVGAALWCSGHIGVYIGNGLGVECTPIWDNGVQITAVGAMGAKSGYHTRNWVKWGLLPWVDYSAQSDSADTDEGDDDMTKERFYELFKEAMKEYRAELQTNECGTWSRADREWAINNGIIAGSPNEDGTPNYMWQDFITREATVALLHRLDKLIEGEK